MFTVHRLARRGRAAEAARSPGVVRARGAMPPAAKASAVCTQQPAASAATVIFFSMWSP